MSSDRVFSPEQASFLKFPAEAGKDPGANGRTPSTVDSLADPGRPEMAPFNGLGKWEVLPGLKIFLQQRGAHVVHYFQKS